MLSEKREKLYTNKCKRNFVFIGLNIFMGIKQLPSYRDYWSSAPDLHDAYVSQMMTINQFG
jgi:hypothetical protein